MADKKLVKEETLTAEQKLIGKISNFFEKNRISVIVLIAVIIVGLVAGVIVANSIAKAKVQAQVKAYDLEAKYFELLAEETPDWASFEAELKSNIKGSSYPSVKEAYLLGLAHFQQEEYAEAQAAFEQAYQLNTSIYMAPLALVNAAACADAQGQTDTALENYNKVYADYPESGVAPKALFNAGRIYFQQGNAQLAKATFEQVVDYYPNSEYGALASNLANQL